MDPPRTHIFPLSQIKHVNQSFTSITSQFQSNTTIRFSKINWSDPIGSPVSHDVYPVFPWCWSNLDHRVYRGVVTREVHLMMDPTRIHTSPLSSNQYDKQPLASRTFNPNQISLLVFKKINWDDPKGLLTSHDVHQVFPEGYLSVYRT